MPFDLFLIALMDHCLSQIDYYDWAKVNNFSLMLPKGTKNCCDEVTAESQSQIDSHLKEKLVKEREFNTQMTISELRQLSGLYQQTKWVI